MVFEEVYEGILATEFIIFFNEAEIGQNPSSIFLERKTCYE